MRVFYSKESGLDFVPRVRGFNFTQCNPTNSRFGGSGLQIVNIYNSSPTDMIVEDSYFIQNRMNSGYGGAIFIYGNCYATFSNCSFLNNYCYLRGGAISFSSVSQVIYDYIIDHCYFEGNYGGGNGGTAIYCHTVSGNGVGTLLIYNSEFNDNWSSTNSAGLVISTQYI